MIKVVIADFDVDNGRKFRAFIKASQSDFTVVKVINDGSDLLPALTETQADLIIADIKYFGAASYQTIQRINQYFPQICLILYGTYDETDYMERSIENGVVTYMYKPVKPGDLQRSLMKAAQVIQGHTEAMAEKNRLLAAYDESKAVFEDRFLINLIHGHIEQEEEIKENFAYFKFPLTAPYRVFVVKINHFSQVSLIYEQREKHLLIFSVLRLVQNKLKAGENGHAFVNHFNTVTAIIGSDYPFDALIQMCEDLKDLIKRDLKITVTVGVGAVCENAVQIPISYKQAKSALRYRYLMGENVIIPIEYMEPENNITYQYPLKKEELLVYSAVVGDVEKTIACLDAIFDSLCKSNEETPLPDKLLAKIVIDIALSIDRYEMEQNTFHPNLFTKFFSVRKTMQVSGIENFYAFFKEILIGYGKAIEQARLIREKEQIKKIKAHVQEHYFENISLSKVALNSGCVPEYLNKIFMEQEGKSYYDFVVSVRLAAAKTLLENPEVDDAKIALSIGYEDVRYFRGIFQQYEGISTDEYRDMYERGVLE